MLLRVSHLRRLLIASVLSSVANVAPPQLAAQPVISTTSAWDGSTALPLLSRDFAPSSIGQTFTTPDGVSTLRSLTVFLGYAPLFFPNDLDLRFHAYLFGWNGSSLTELIWRSPVQNGAADLPLETRSLSVGGIPVAEGSRYAVVLSTLEADPFDAAGAFATSFPAFQNIGVVDSDAYAGGTLIQSFEADWSTLLSSTWQREPAADLAISLEFDPRGVPSVPEPATEVLLACAAALLFATRIRRFGNAHALFR